MARAQSVAQRTLGDAVPSASTAPRTIIVSNRLPLTVSVERNGVSLHPSAGGVATGLREVRQSTRSLWIGWPGVSDPLSLRLRNAIRERLHDEAAVPVHLGRQEVEAFYNRFSNGLLWPVLHERVDFASATRGDWATYRAVNERFADEIARRVRPGDRIWVHDYHLMLLPQLLRERRVSASIGFFLHTPFPRPEIFSTVPWWRELSDGLLGADLIGFHTPEYAANYLSTVTGTAVAPMRRSALVVDRRRVTVSAHPMGIDFASFSDRASLGSVVGEARAIHGPDGRALFLGVDRLDYTKGIPERLVAFERLLEERRELAGRVRLIQVAVPSRTDVAAYRDLRGLVERLVERINRRFGNPAWLPVDYRYGCVDVHTLATLYRAADVMLVTPLRDGMNLVAKEFVASRPDEDGVLVLSRFAGAARELQAAVLVDPRDVDTLARAYHAALTMSRTERRGRMQRLRRTVREHDVFRWAAQFLEAIPA